MERTYFAENAAAYGVELTQLHVNFEEAFGDQGTCATSGANKTIVANHNAYSYISVRYGVDIMAVHGLDPEGEPSPAEVAEVVEQIKEEGITTLYVEEYTDQTAVQSIVEETGVEAGRIARNTGRTVNGEGRFEVCVQSSWFADETCCELLQSYDF